MSWKQTFGIPEHEPELPKVDPVTLVVRREEYQESAVEAPINMDEVAEAPLVAVEDGARSTGGFFSENPRNAGTGYGCDSRSASLKATSQKLPPSHIIRR